MLGAQRHVFTGHVHDAATGLVYMRGRFYDPVVGLFISADLLPGRPMDPRSQHAYLYAHGNPLANFDPTGLASESPSAIREMYAPHIEGASTSEEKQFWIEQRNIALHVNLQAKQHEEEDLDPVLGEARGAEGSCGNVRECAEVVGASGSLRSWTAQPESASPGAGLARNLKGITGAVGGAVHEGSMTVATYTPMGLLLQLGGTSPREVNAVAMEAIHEKVSPYEEAVRQELIRSGVPEDQIDSAIAVYEIGGMAATVGEISASVRELRVGRGVRARPGLTSDSEISAGSRERARTTTGRGDEAPPSSVGAVRRLEYEPHSEKHAAVARGRASAAPASGQEALDSSIQISENSSRRVGIDYEAGEYVVFHEHLPGRFHGFVVPWEDLTNAMRSALRRAGMANKKGGILKD